MEAVCLQEKFFYFVSACVPHCSDAPNDIRFLSNAFNRCFKPSGILLKLCRLILGCFKKFYLVGYSWGTWIFSNLLGLFSPFPENLRSYRLSENDSWPYLVAKTTFLTIRKQQTLNSYITKVQGDNSLKKIRGD